MRRGEILGLRWDDVDFNRDVILVRRSKNGESREIPMTRKLRATLFDLPRTSDQVFTSRKGEAYRSIRNAFLRAVRSAELRDLRFHDLRHVFASNLRMGGADLFLLKELLGHKTLAMTMRYAHITCTRKREVIGVLDGEFLESGSGDVVREVIDKAAKSL
jgi:integrase